jgi:hypothetical protein
MNADKILFRASSMGDIMTGVAKGWSVEDSLTCKRKLVQIYRELTWQRRTDKGNKYTEKGNAVEEDSITLYSRLKKEVFKKNDIRLENDFFTGEVDLFKGEEIRKAEKTIDTKSCWDWTTMPSICDTVDAGYEYQGLTYLDLTGANVHTVAYCLVNTPASLIMDEKKKLAWKMGVIDTEPQEYIDACIEIEKNHIYDMPLFLSHHPYFELHCKDWKYDVPMAERLYEIDVLRNNTKIQKMKDRVIECREWMNKNLFKKKLIAA